MDLSLQPANIASGHAAASTGGATAAKANTPALAASFRSLIDILANGAETASGDVAPAPPGSAPATKAAPHRSNASAASGDAALTTDPAVAAESARVARWSTAPETAHDDAAPVEGKKHRGHGKDGRSGHGRTGTDQDKTVVAPAPSAPVPVASALALAFGLGRPSRAEHAGTTDESAATGATAPSPFAGNGKKATGTSARDPQGAAPAGDPTVDRRTSQSGKAASIALAPAADADLAKTGDGSEIPTQAPPVGAERLDAVLAALANAAAKSQNPSSGSSQPAAASHGNVPQSAPASQSNDAAIDTGRASRFSGVSANAKGAPAPAASGDPTPTFGASLAAVQSHVASQAGVSLLNVTGGASPTGVTSLPDTTVAEIIQAIRLQAMGDGGEAHIRLEPSQFGELTISIKVDQGQVVARLQADSPVVREWLQTNQGLLRHQLAEQHLTLDRLEVVEPPSESDRSDRQSTGERAPEDGRQPRRQRPTDTGELFEVVA